VSASGSSSISSSGSSSESSASSVARAAFRAPGAPLPLGELLARGWPQVDAATRAEWIGRGAVRIEGRAARKPASVVAPGRQVELRDVIPEPALGLPDAVSDLRVLVPFMPWHRGVLARRRGMATGLAFERLDERDRLCELIVCPEASEQVTSGEAFASDARRCLGEAGFPVLGDVRHGGILVAGGPRIRPAASELPDWWPTEPAFPGDPDGGEPPVLRVSASTCRIVGRGHPWVLRDEGTDDPSPFTPGTRVDLRGPRGEELGTACIEGSGRLTARVWAAGRERSVESRVAAALARRKPLLESVPGAPVTDAYRLVHGEADGLPGLFVDRLGGLLRVLVASPGTSSYRERALDALAHGFKSVLGTDPPVVEVMHLRERPPGELECTRLARGTLPAPETDRVVVRERGVRFLVDPGLERPMRSSPGVGLYLDQRENRAKLVAGGADGRLLNLFAHTGAFSVAWLAAGAGEAVSVDLSRPYLRWIDENLAANDIDFSRHRGVRQDGRRFLETLARSERFDAIVIDPPTAAAAGRRFWSVAKELPQLLELAFAHLAPGGRLLVSRNDRQRKSLEAIVGRAASAARLELARVEAARPGIDFPRRAGFPEGDSFSAVLVLRT
jgi:23S rRNA (cytosine1962-C5)-methyltransferase